MTLWNSAAGIAIVALVWIWSSQCDASSHTSRPYEDVVYNPLISIHYPEHKPLLVLVHLGILGARRVAGGQRTNRPRSTNALF